jgi:hypothetical protein
LNSLDSIVIADAALDWSIVLRSKDTWSATCKMTSRIWVQTNQLESWLDCQNLVGKTKTSIQKLVVWESVAIEGVPLIRSGDWEDSHRDDKLATKQPRVINRSY